MNSVYNIYIIKCPIQYQIIYAEMIKDRYKNILLCVVENNTIGYTNVTLEEVMHCCQTNYEYIKNIMLPLIIKKNAYKNDIIIIIYSGNDFEIKKDTINKIFMLGGKNNDTFPYKQKNYIDVNKIIMEKFDKLAKFNYLDNVSKKMYKIDNINDTSINYNGKPEYILLMGKNEDYYDYNILSDLFNEECRMKCAVIWAKMSPYDYWNRNYKHIINYAKKHSDNNISEKIDNLKNHNYREALYKLYYNGKGECTSHRPTNIISLMQIFGAKKILDPCMGWGDRLIGAIAGKCDIYVGTDPNPCVHVGYKKIIHMFNYQNKAKAYIEKFENFNNPDNFIYDMAYTSPPYFDYETYTNDERQSIINYPSENKWFDNFLSILLNKCIEYVKINGIIAINIGEGKHNTYISNMIKYMNENKKKYVNYLGIISYGDSVNTAKPIFIWQKIKNP